MTKTEHIDFWINSSNDDWITVDSLFNSGRYVHCLFFAHLSLEKLCKAMWVRDNSSNFPPKTHNLVKLLNQTNENFERNIIIFLEEFNDFQIEGRYPDYLNEIKRICNLEFTKDLVNKVSEIRTCILGKLH